jgi:hypothetical protein
MKIKELHYLFREEMKELGGHVVDFEREPSDKWMAGGREKLNWEEFYRGINKPLHEN